MQARAPLSNYARDCGYAVSNLWSKIQKLNTLMYLGSGCASYLKLEYEEPYPKLGCVYPLIRTLNTVSIGWICSLPEHVSHKTDTRI